jgi:transposase
VKDYVRGEQVRSREVFVPLTHARGEAQADFGEALVVIAGVEQKAHYLVMGLPHSDDCFVAAFPAETTEAFLEGHVRAFAYFGGVPTRILYDYVPGNIIVVMCRRPFCGADENSPIIVGGPRSGGHIIFRLSA